MDKDRVLLGLSGGLDSAMSAVMLQWKGFRVHALYLQLYDSPSTQIEKVSDLAKRLSIELTIVDARQTFKETVIDTFLDGLMQGKTPSPCIHCNPSLKWKLLAEKADEFGIHWIATGHYINILPGKDTSRILKASDPLKDQSYFLWPLAEHILKRIISPLGVHTKTEIREMAIGLGFHSIAKQKESTGLCFANGLSVNELLHKYRPDILQHPGPGIIIDKDGKPIGKHMGYPFYTIGQKKGLELDVPEKLCVVKIDAPQNLLVVDTWQSLYTKLIQVVDFHVFDEEALKDASNLEVKIRGFGLNPSKGARITMNEGLLKIDLFEPAWAPAPGQPVVIYKDELVVAGGIIV